MCNAGASNVVGPFAFRYQGNGATPCQYIDTTRKAIDCATTLPLTVFGLSVRCLSCLSVCPVCPVRNVRALWPNGWTDQDETCLAGRPRPWPHCVRWGPSSLSPDGAQPPIFGPCLFRPNGCMDQDATWYGGRPWPMRLCVRWGPRNLWPIFIVAKRLVDQDGAWRGGRT